MIIVLTNHNGKCSCCKTQYVEPVTHISQPLDITEELWLRVKNSYYCPDCWFFDENGQPAINYISKNPPTLTETA
jgi:hypothetical protein